MATSFSAYLDMAPGDLRHAILVTSASGVIGNAVAHLPYVVTVANLRLQVNQSAACFYPDVMVFCDRPKCFNGNYDLVSNPAVSIEVGSEATDVWDRAVKFRYYRCIPSLREYILVSQDEMCIEWYTRQDNGEWVYHAATTPEDVCHLSSLGVTLSLADVYRKIELA